MQFTMIISEINNKCSMLHQPDTETVTDRITDTEAGCQKPDE